MGGVVRSKPTNDTDSQFSIVEYLVIEGDEQTSNVFSLREVTIELGIQVLKHSLTNRRSCM